jgi:hypothetical protein
MLFASQGALFILGNTFLLKGAVTSLSLYTALSTSMVGYLSYLGVCGLTQLAFKDKHQSIKATIDVVAGSILSGATIGCLANFGFIDARLGMMIPITCSAIAAVLALAIAQQVHVKGPNVTVNLPLEIMIPSPQPTSQALSN